MKRVTASQARREWFRLLDDVAAGEVVTIERNGQRIVIQRQNVRASGVPRTRYADLLSADHAERADEWSWEWKGPGKSLRPSSRRAR